MDHIRPAAVAGKFYPADPERLRDQIDEFLGGASSARRDVERRVRGRASADGSSADVAGGDASTAADTADNAAAARHAGDGTHEHGRVRPRALIVPHAGYIYSGPVAATAFDTLGDAARDIRRAVIIGPSHYVPFAGVALPEADAFETPLGELELDTDAVERLHEVEAIVTWAEPHRREHGIEVELPFLQQVVGEIPIVPLVTGSATPEQVATILDALWDDETLLLVSSDLSHFLDYETACRLDAETADIIVEGPPDDLDERRACGRLAIQGMKISAARRGLDIELLDLRNSGDTAGPRNQVVGYGAFRID